jgi:acetyl esterase/lipase
VRRLFLAAVVLAVGFPACASGAADRPATKVAKPAGASPLRYRDAVFPRVSVTRDIQYGTAPDAAGNPVPLTLDLYAPTGDRVRSRPAVEWIHGGGFRTGSKSNRNVVELATAFAQRGYVAVSINYRLLAAGVVCGGTTPTPPACVGAAVAARDDAQVAVQWLRANAKRLRIDPHRVAAGGTSAGAVTSLLLATGPTDRSTAIGAAVSISGTLPGGQFTKADAPTLFFHGTADRTVPYAGGRATADAMAAAGIPVVFETLQGAGHVPWQYRSRYITQSAYFFYHHLGLG